MDILFINPRTEIAAKSKVFHREPPNGLLTLCAILENAGYAVEFIDLSVSNNLDLKNYLKEAPRIVGITSLTNTHNQAMRILQMVKEISQEFLTLYGGPHATFKYKEVLQKHKYVDYILCGEADLTILDYMRLVFNDNVENEAKKVRNLAFRDGNEIFCSHSYVAADLERLPLPARHLIDLRHYQVGTIIVNRGCPFHCSFCVRQKIFKKVRFRKPHSVAEEMVILSRLGFEFINLYDNINARENYGSELCKVLKNFNHKWRWGCELRADRIARSLAVELKSAGCEVVAVGVESGDPNVLRIANKNQDLKQIQRGIEAAKKANLAVQAYFIIGLPGENESSFEKTVQFLGKLKLEPGMDRINFFAATPYPGTPLYEFPDQFGARILNENWDLYDNSNLLMDIDSLEFEELEKKWEIAKEIEKEFNLV